MIVLKLPTILFEIPKEYGFQRRPGFFKYIETVIYKKKKPNKCIFEP